MLTSLTLQSSLRSVLLHIAAVLLLVISFDFPSRKTPQMPRVNIVEAVAVDSTQVEKELQRLQEIDTAKAQEELAKQQKLEQQVRELEKKSTQAETKRKEEEKRLADLEKKKLQEQKARETEQKKLADLKKQQEELERKAEDEKKRKEAEAAHQKQLAEQQAEQQLAQQGQDQALLQSITANIYRSVVSNYNVSGLPPGLECVLIVRTVPGGEVVSVSISQSSGNEIFDRRAINAVQKASPLPLPEDAATFERLGLRQFRLPFRPQ